MEVAPFFVDFHHFLSIFTIFYRFSRFTHFFPKFFLAKIAFSATSHVFCMYGTMHTIFCLTFLSPGWVRAPQGWLLAVQGHVDQVQELVQVGEDVPQVVKLESCLFQGRHCEYLPPCYKSSCLQLFSPFPLISVDPNRPEQPPVIALIPLPSACSCLVLY